LAQFPGSIPSGVKRTFHSNKVGAPLSSAVQLFALAPVSSGRTAWVLTAESAWIVTDINLLCKKIIA